MRSGARDSLDRRDLPGRPRGQEQTASRVHAGHRWAQLQPVAAEDGGLTDSSASESEEDPDYETDDTDVESHADRSDAPWCQGPAWMAPDPEHPPEYYVQQRETLDTAEIVEEDYAASTTGHLDACEQRWFRYVSSSSEVRA